MSKKLISIFAALAAIVLFLSMTAYGSGNDIEFTLTDEDFDALMKQVAASDVQNSYGDYLTDQPFADAEMFGIDRNSGVYSAYAYLYEGEYVVLKDKAYEMSGSAGEVIIRFTFDEDRIVLSEVIWSADGGEHDKWLKKNFPANYYRRAKSYQAHDENGRSILGSKLEEKVSAELGVPIETENLLEIDIEKGTYQIIKPIYRDDGLFDFETVEQGSIGEINN